MADVADETLVVRGGKLVMDRLRRSAEQASRDPRVGEPALSVFRSLAPRDRGHAEHVADACRQVPNRTVQWTHVGRLRDAGFRVTQTGANPAHCTVWFANLNREHLEAFIACFEPNEESPTWSS